MMSDFYKVGGSLRYDHPTYITRQADREIYEALKQREFCYVLNSRQMGKSSLRVRTMKVLTKEGFKCVAIDLGILGRFTTAERWYGGLLAELWRKLRLSKGIDDDLAWWRSHSELSPVQRFSRFIEDILLVNCSADIIVFLDEIDNLINLDFRDEFFSLVRNCYEQRVESEPYCRLTFCLLGVATPSNLRIDKQLSPFNIGCGIGLTGFNFTESQPLLQGLSNVDRPEAILQEILSWTNGQPFLTQKLCALVDRYATKYLDLPQLIQQRIIDNWEIQDEPEHLKTIRDRLLHHPHPDRLLTLYQNVLRQNKIAVNGSDEQVELRLSGLVTRQQGNLKVSNPIYERVFDRQWVTRQLSAIAPYQDALVAWLKSQKDSSRLLRGKALVEGQTWARRHSITYDEREFLRTSELLAIEDEKQARLARKAEFVARELEREQRLVRWQRLFIFFSLLMVSGFYLKSRQANLSNINALVQSSKALDASERKLDALQAAIAAKQKLDRIWGTDRKLSQQVDNTLQVVYDIKEQNRLLGHSDRLYGVAVSDDGKLIATAASDNTVRLWQRTKGWQLQEVLKHDGWVVDVAIAPDNRTVATASHDRTAKLWRDGKLSQTLQHSQAVSSVAIERNRVITGSVDGKIRIWQNGQLIQTLKGHTAAVEAIAIAPDNSIISASEDKTLKIWQEGKLVNTLTGHTAGVRTVALTPDGSKIISGSRDKTIRIWLRNGQEIAILKHQSPVYGVAVNPAGDRLVSASGDRTIKIWSIDGTEIATLGGHTNRVWDVAYTPDGKIASASWDKTARLWQPENNLTKTLSDHQDVAIALDYQDNLIASTSDDKTVKLWNSSGTLLKTFNEHTAEVYDVALSDRLIASVGADKTLRIWQADSDNSKTIQAHNSAIWSVEISPKQQKIITAGDDRQIKIWDLNGNLLQTIQGHTRKIWDIAISPNEDYFVSASEDNTVKVWNFQGELLRTLKGHRDAVRTVATDGTQIISAGEDRKIEIWDRQGIVATLNKHEAIVKTVALSPNGQYLASADDDGKIILWQRGDRIWQPYKTLFGHDNSSIWSVAFSPDGETLATAGEDSKVILWNLNKVLDLDPLQYGYNWLKDYLQQSKVSQ